MSSPADEVDIAPHGWCHSTLRLSGMSLRLAQFGTVKFITNCHDNRCTNEQRLPLAMHIRNFGATLFQQPSATRLKLIAPTVISEHHGN